MRKKLLIGMLVAAFAVACTTLIGLYAYAGVYGFNVILRRGGSVWISVAPDDSRLSGSMRLALRDSAPVATAGSFSWREVDRGFEVAELPVISGGSEVDRILLARVEPSHFQFQVRTAPAGNKDLGDWMRDLGAALVINGSYFSRYGAPDTPLLSAGIPSGPTAYDARHGAFVASIDVVSIRDLEREDWRVAFRGASDAMVSYPLLLGTAGTGRVKADRRWLANRSFVGQDKSGRIILGTTKDAFFSLDRFAEFLRQAPLELNIALNLDGGPVACQGIKLKDYRRDFCGDWETATHDGELKLLARVVGSRRWALPIVLAIIPK